MSLLGCLGRLFLLLTYSGCGMAWGRHEMVPTTQADSSRGPLTQSVELYRQGKMPRKQFFRIALVAAHGSGYATSFSFAYISLPVATPVHHCSMVLVLYDGRSVDDFVPGIC